MIYYFKNISKTLLGIWIILSVNCSKGKEIDSDYAGTWECYSGTLVKIICITDYSNNSYYKECQVCSAPICDCWSESDGRARVSGKKLYIGITKFAIDQKPTDQGNGVWIMILDGNKYISSKSPKDYCHDGIQNNGEKGIDCGGACGNYCFDNSSFNLDNASSFYTNELEVIEGSGNFDIYADYNSLEGFDPVPTIHLKFKATAKGSYLLDSTSYFAMAINDPGATTAYYNCVSGTIIVDSINPTTNFISIQYNFNAKNKVNGRSVEIKNGIISNLIYKK